MYYFRKILVLSFTIFFAKAITFRELSELSTVLNQLTNIKSLNVRFEPPSEEFYSKLQKIMYKAFVLAPGNSLVESKYEPELLDVLGSSPTIKTVKFMMKIAYEEGLTHKSEQNIVEYVSSKEIVTLIRIYNSIIENYDKSNELVIASVGCGYLEKEYLLLRALVAKGYSKIKFYGIDPNKATKNKLERFKGHLNFQGITFGYFVSSYSYIQEKIIKEQEIPNVCVIFGPYVDRGKENINFIKIRDSAILALPGSLEELSILSSDNFEKMDQLNAKLSLMIHPRKKNIESLFKQIAGGYYSSIHSVILDFLEIIKLASSKKDCIAYLMSGDYGITVRYKKIATKSLAKLYSEFQGLYDEQRIKCPCIAWIYDSITNQFVVENSFYFSDEYKDLVKQLIR